MPRIVPLILAFALFMENMDSTVIATSLAAIATDIGSDPISLKLALTAYLVALAIFIPVSSWMADKYGSHNVFRVAMGIFILGSLACAFSNSLLAFVVSRFVQGMGGAMMSPLARLILVRATPRHELVTVMAWLTVPALVGPVVGPPVGGFLTTYFGWHWIFLINVPIGLVGIWLAGLYLPRSTVPPPGRIDTFGFILVGLSFAGIVFGLSVISLPALPPVVGYVTVAVGLVIGADYVVRYRQVEHPIVDLSLLRFPLFRSSIVAGSFFRLGVGATPFLLPLMFQLAFGLTPFESGMVTFVGAFGALAAKFVAHWMFVNYGFRTPLVASSVISAALIAVMGLYNPATPVPLIMALLVVGGFAHSTFFTGIMAFAFADIPARDESQANVIIAVSAQLAFALGVALGGGILEASHALHGGEITLSDFHTAFFIVGAVAALAAILFMRLPADAGAEISGHKFDRTTRDPSGPEPI